MLERGKEEAETTETVRGVRKSATNSIAWAEGRASCRRAEGLSVVDGETHPCVPGAAAITPTPAGKRWWPTQSQACRMTLGAWQHSDANQALAASHLLHQPLVWASLRGLSLQR